MPWQTYPNHKRSMTFGIERPQMMETNMDYQIDPCSLDDVIRANRDKCRLAFATDEELQKLNGGVSYTPSRPDVTNWQIIVMHIRQDDGSAVDYAFLVGWCLDTRGPLMSSRIDSVDLKSGLVETWDGCVYRVDGRELNDERFMHLDYICASLHEMGLGEKYGVPQFPHFF